MQKPCRARGPGEFGTGGACPHQLVAPGTPLCPTVVRGDPASIAMGRPQRTLFRLAGGPARGLFLGGGSVYNEHRGAPGWAQPGNREGE